MTVPSTERLAVSRRALRVAVTTLRLGLVDHRVVEPERWDDAVTTAARACFEIDGAIRRQIFGLFRAARWGEAEELERAINQLSEGLAVDAWSTPSTCDQLRLFPLPGGPHTCAET